MGTLLRDVKYGARTLRRSPGFTLVVVLTLALSIGANTAIFSVVYAVLLRPLPFPHPEQLVIVRDDLPGRRVEDVGMSVPEFKDLQEGSGAFEQVSALWPADANLTGSDRPERIELLAVSPNYFSLLGASAQLGRVFDQQDRAAGFAEAVVISDGLWRRLFGADPQVLGRKVYLDSDPYTIVGVMPPDFRHPGRTLHDEVDVWATAGFEADPFGTPVRGRRLLPGAIARIKSGMNVGQAQARVDVLVARLREQFPDVYPPEAGWNVRLLPAHENLVGGTRTTLLVLLTAVGLMLLLGCVNIAGLLLARSASRQREMAIRLALGATRGRLAAQLLTESLLLSLLGGALALLVLGLTLRLLVGFVPADIPRLDEVGIDGAVLGFALLVTVLTGFLFGLIPSLQASRPDLVTGLKEGGKGAGSSARSQRFRSALVVAEVALSLVLMIAAGLLLRSYGLVSRVDGGFDQRDLLVARIWLPLPNNPEANPYRSPSSRAAFVREVLRRASALPGVKYAAVGGGTSVPLLGTHPKRVFSIRDVASAEQPTAQVTAVSPDYFRALGTPLVRGRYFADGDAEQAPGVVLIDEAAAQIFWPNEDPIGRQIKQGGRDSKAPWLTIVGVVGNVKADGFDRPDQPHIYLSVMQSPDYALAVYVRAQGNPGGLAQPLRREVHQINPSLPVFGERTMEEIVAASLSRRRFALQVVGAFGVLALLLAGVGVYGVVSNSVSQRAREIGIRLALGSTTGAILRRVMGQGLRLALAGVAAGLLTALAVTRLLSGLLFGVAPTDPLTYAGLSLLLTAVALLACYVPARRATKVDPLAALRHE